MVPESVYNCLIETGYEQGNPNMDKAKQIARALKLLDEVDYLVQEACENCYDLYQKVNDLYDDIADRAREEGIDVPEWPIERVRQVTAGALSRQ